MTKIKGTVDDLCAAIDVSMIESGQWVVGTCGGLPFEGEVWMSGSRALWVGNTRIHEEDFDLETGTTITSVTDSRPDNPKRVITTAEELDALGVRSVVLDRGGDAWQKDYGWGWELAGGVSEPTLDMHHFGPFTVLHDTTPPAPAMEPLPTEPSAIWATGVITGNEYLVFGPDLLGNWRDHDGSVLPTEYIAAWRYYTGPESVGNVDGTDESELPQIAAETATLYFASDGGES